MIHEANKHFPPKKTYAQKNPPKILLRRRKNGTLGCIFLQKNWFYVLRKTCFSNKKPAASFNHNALRKSRLFHYISIVSRCFRLFVGFWNISILIHLFKIIFPGCEFFQLSSALEDKGSFLAFRIVWDTSYDFPIHDPEEFGTPEWQVI